MEVDMQQESTLRSLLQQGTEIFGEARRQMPNLPVNPPQVSLPPNFSEAQTLVQAREEERRKAAARSVKHKPRSSRAQDVQRDAKFPGATPGAEANITALWLATEGYFRDVTSRDLALLCPAYDDPLQDPIFSIPDPGPAFETEEERSDRLAQQARLAAAAVRPPPTAQLPAAEQPPAVVSPADAGDSLSNGGAAAGDLDKLRKSRRLGAKADTRRASQPHVQPPAPRVRSPTRRDPPAVAPAAAGPTVAAPEVPPPAVAKEDGPLLRGVSDRHLACLVANVAAVRGCELPDAGKAAGGWRLAAGGKAASGELQGWLDECLAPSSQTPEAGLAGSARTRVQDWLAEQAQEARVSPGVAAAQSDEGRGGASSLPPLSIPPTSLPPTSVPPASLPPSPPADSWSAWLHKLRLGGTPPSAVDSLPPLERVHRFTELLLDAGPSVCVDLPGALGGREGGAATPSNATPSQSGDPGRAGQDATLDTASAQPRGPPPMLLAQGLLSASPFTPTPSTSGPPPLGSSLAHPPTPNTPANGPFAPTPELASRRQSHAEAGPSHATGAGSGKSRLGGGTKRKAPSLSASLHKSSKQRVPSIDPGRNALTAAVHAHVASGPGEGGVEEQWQQLREVADVMALAPDDELLAETMALQSELLQQMLVNRRNMASLLGTVLQDLPRQREASAQREAGVAAAKAWIAKQRAERKSVKREKREAAARDAQKAAEAFLQVSPRKAPGRIRGQHSLDTNSSPPSAAATPPPEGGRHLVDRLAERGAEEEALCCVCGGGDSSKEAGNEIVFCERCDMAVHQKCYRVDTIPAGEWLCWACKRFEEGELRSGKPQSQIRPPRWERDPAAAGSPNKDLPGGGRTVACYLCPVRHGAFRQTSDCKHWVHQVCALWHPETEVQPSPACATVQGVDDIRPERWGVPCAVCGSKEGAIVRCKSGHCTSAFHPLCARNNGQYLTIREVAGKLAYRIYCPQHSQMQRDKDLGLAHTSSQAEPKEKAAAKDRGVADRAAAAAVEGYEARVEERRVMTRVRLELESLRILLQRINKREKLKRDEVKANYELLRGRLSDPSWDLPPASQQADATSSEALGRGKRSRNREPLNRSPSVQVDRELMMTTGEAAATNDRLPRGFMYVPYSRLQAESPTG